MSLKGTINKYKKWIILLGCAVGVLRIMNILPEVLFSQTIETTRLIYAGVLFAAAVVYLTFHKEQATDGYRRSYPAPPPPPLPRRPRQMPPQQKRPLPQPRPQQDPTYDAPEDIGDEALADELGMNHPSNVNRDLDKIYDGF
jgi:hypothetical protein